jgi:DNA invertase Pin-like site-specific DNA recombinase
MRAAIYIRVSTEKQEAENQALQLREYCQRVGYQVVKEYSDVISGKENSRPAYNLMFDDASKHLFDVVVFWDISRFSRSGSAYTLQKLQQLDNLKIAWESYQEQYFRSLGPFKEAVIAIMAAVAQMEREKISERTKAGLAHARLQGKYPGRPKGVKDRNPRRKKGYYDNNSRLKGLSKKGGSEIATPEPLKIGEVERQEKHRINARLLQDEKLEEGDEK